MPSGLPATSQVRRNRTGGLNIVLTRLDGRGLDRIAESVAAKSKTSHALHTLVYGSERIAVDASRGTLVHAATRSSLLVVSRECGGRTRNLVGLVDLARAGRQDMASLAGQLNDLADAERLAAGAIVVRDHTGNVFWSRLPHEVLASRQVRGTDVVSLLTDRPPFKVGRYRALSELLSPYMRDNWRPLLISVHPTLAQSIATDLDLSSEYESYRQGLHPHDPDIPAPSFYAAEIPLQEHNCGLNDDKVAVVLSKGAYGAKYLAFNVYLAPEGCPDPKAWNALRRENNTQNETRRILDLA